MYNKKYVNLWNTAMLGNTILDKNKKFKRLLVFTDSLLKRIESFQKNTTE